MPVNAPLPGRGEGKARYDLTMARARRPGSAPVRPDSTQPVAAGRMRVANEAVTPEVDGGRFPSKRSLGERVAVEADVFADGHDALSGVIRYRPQSESAWTEAPL